jgi:hypothetical protein
MRRKLMGISALTCLVGGSMLVAPATSQAGYRSCEEMVGSRCTGGGITYCDNYGSLEPLVCSGGSWTPL